MDNSNISIITDGRLRKAQLKMLEMLKIVDAICSKHQIHYWLDAGTLLGCIRHHGFIPWDDDADIAMPRKSYEKFLQVAPQEIPEHIHLQKAGHVKNYYNLGAPLKIRDKNSYYLEKHEIGNETYQQGIFIDVFVYDQMWSTTWKHKAIKRISRKCLRILGTKHSALPMGRNHFLYKLYGMILPKSLLYGILDYVVSRANKLETPYIGRGYHCKKITLIEKNDVFPLKRQCFEDTMLNIPQHAERILKKEYGDFWQLPPLEERGLRHCQNLIPEL
jgi:lipopolysaccharide cholinephosphotransferase